MAELANSPAVILRELYDSRFTTSLSLISMGIYEKMFDFLPSAVSFVKPSLDRVEQSNSGMDCIIVLLGRGILGYNQEYLDSCQRTALIMILLPCSTAVSAGLLV
jgi:hypothetical protein